ncbi:hypothetical protein ACOMHN_003428 [Nucella lapillus]
MADHAEDKDVPMEDADVAAEDEDELLGTKDEPENKNADESKPEEEEQECDSGAASDAEFGAEDDRGGQTDAEDAWTWHIEMYPITPEDSLLDNFIKIVGTSEQCNVIFRTTENGEKKGEAHFYTNDSQAAKVVIRTICCRKFSAVRPFVYLYYKPEEGEIETASVRLDLIEAAKMRWDRQRKNIGDPSTRVAKVSEVPLSTSKEFLNVLFARAFHIKRESDESEAAAAKKVIEASEKSQETNNEEDKEDEKEESEEEDQEIGEFNGNLTIDCVSRTSLKGFLLGYRKVIIGSNLLNVKALSVKDFDMEDLRKEVWGERRQQGRQRGGRGGGGGRGARGNPNRGGRGDYRSNNRGGIMTGRQKMEEKMRRGGGRDMRGGGGRGYGGLRDEMQYQMAMNTYRLERQMISMRGRGRDFGLLPGGYRDYAPDPYEMALAPRGYGGYDPRDDWGYRNPRFSGAGLGRIPMRNMRGRRL